MGRRRVPSQAMTRDVRSDRSSGDEVPALLPERLEPVVPTVFALVHHDPATVLEDELGGTARVFPDVPTLPYRRPDMEAVAAVVVAVSLAANDIRLGLGCGVLVGVAAAVRLVDRRIPFSFGEGFVGYRSDAGWPRGVQEEDGVHWKWKRPGPDPRDRYP